MNYATITKLSGTILDDSLMETLPEQWKCSVVNRVDTIINNISPETSCYAY